MKAQLFVATLAAVTLASCSSKANSFDGKTPEQVATYLAFGLEDKAEAFDKDMKIVAGETSTQPFTIAVIANLNGTVVPMMQVVTTTSDNCTFTFAFTPQGNLRQMMQDTKLSINFTKLKSVKVTTSESAQFDGAEIQCLEPAGRDWCKKVNQEPMSGKWQSRIGPFDKDKSKDGDQARVNEAVAYLQENICKPQ
ncbi:hypothetical protein DXT98_01390 [Agrobacterium sp. ICMP 7243]|nr:hypothetical protein DXT98_01390 [Agrobacterium sp. ICMP 7243]